MRFLTRWFGATALTGLVLLSSSGAATGQSFVLSQNGKTVGSATLSLKQTQGGFTSNSGAKVDMPGLKYSFSENESLDSGYHLQNVQLSGAVNGTSATVGGAPQGQQFLMKINASGKVTNSPLAMHSQAIFYPDFDPGALQVLLNLGAAHNNRDLWAIIPKQTGSVDALRVATKQDEQGTLDGRQVVVHHVTVTTATETTEIFSSASNQLLQAEWPAEGFALVREGFLIKPPAKPRSAPPAKQPAGQTGVAAQPLAPSQGTAPAPQPQQ